MKKTSKVLVPILLIIMLATMLGSSWGDSAVSDERVHIAAGYSYLTTGDYRLNPEHPPLIKDIAAFPLLFGGFSFPYTYYYGKKLPNEWVVGSKFLYGMGNNLDRMLFLSRFPLILLTLFLGFYVFKWARELYGEKAGLFALFLYIFDANILAHGHYVTTDLGIAAALFINMYVLLRFLRRPTKKAFLLTGLTFGIVLVTKFSAGLLIPVYGLVLGLELIRKPVNISGDNVFRSMFDAKLSRRTLGYIKSFSGIACLGIIFLYLFYLPHVMNMSAPTMRALIKHTLSFRPFKPDWAFRLSSFSVHSLRKLTGIAFMKPFAQYLIGFLIVTGHVTRGSRIFFMGHVAMRFNTYYPVVFLIKVAIPTLIFFAVSLFVLGKKMIRDRRVDYTKLYLLIPIVVFFTMATIGSLDLGIRYLLPIFPFMFVFVSDLANKIDFAAVSKVLKGKLEKPAVPAALFIALMIWYGAGSLRTYPYYLAYFNELIGGPKNGINYVTDSNLDIGQDLKRLAAYVNEHHIKKIRVEYFGSGVDSGDVSYYLGSKGIAWRHTAGKPPNGYYAFSATYYSKEIGGHYKDFGWLSKQKPVAVIGYSMLVFKVR